MKNKISILCLLLLFFGTIHSQSNIAIILNEYELGAWALKQHNDICEKVHPAISDGKITAYTSDNKMFNKKEALKVFETTYVAFISTDPDDPRKGYDTTVSSPSREKFHSFTITDMHVKIMVEKTGKTVQFDKAQFYKLLTEENQVYLQKYAQDNKVIFENIPMHSTGLIKAINVKLDTESRKPGTELFKTDSLLSKFNDADKKTRGKNMVTAFISTDPNDPTIGHDTVLSESLNINDTSVYQAVCFILATRQFNMFISAIGSGFHPTFNNPNIKILMPLGFLKYDKTTSLTIDDRKLLEYCLQFCIKDKLEPHPRYYYNEYMEIFKITPKD